MQLALKTLIPNFLPIFASKSLNSIGTLTPKKPLLSFGSASFLNLNETTRFVKPRLVIVGTLSKNPSCDLGKINVAFSSLL